MCLQIHLCIYIYKRNFVSMVIISFQVKVYHAQRSSRTITYNRTEILIVFVTYLFTLFGNFLVICYRSLAKISTLILNGKFVVSNNPSKHFF